MVGGKAPRGFLGICSSSYCLPPVKSKTCRKDSRHKTFVDRAEWLSRLLNVPLILLDLFLFMLSCVVWWRGQRPQPRPAVPVRHVWCRYISQPGTPLTTWSSLSHQPPSSWNPWVYRPLVEILSHVIIILLLNFYYYGSVNNTIFKLMFAR